MKKKKKEETGKLVDDVDVGAGPASVNNRIKRFLRRQKKNVRFRRDS
jgi:hypothetical protein